MEEFTRYIDEKLISKLESTELWNEKLKADCKKGDVFLAIRKDYLSFYYKGGGLFTFDGDNYKTHIKYASVIDKTDENSSKNYLTEQNLNEYKLIHSFFDKYQRIKENCKHYSGLEAEGVSNLYRDSSYLLKDPIGLLDIEIAFKTKEKKQDRIDILLYDSGSRELRFIEAKHFTNKEIWSKNTPPVINQIKKYEEQIATNNDRIIEQYGFYVKTLNILFGSKLPVPKKIDPKVSLLIFGFDDDQKKGRLKELIGNKYSGVSIYSRGDETGICAKTIWAQAKPR